MNSYLQMKQRHQQEFNDFPIKFAFSQAQLEQGLIELGLQSTDTDKVVATPGGGFIRETDQQAFLDLFARQDRERSEAIAADTDGTGFAYEMFRYELANHEYAYTMDPTDTLEALGFELDEVAAVPALQKAFTNAQRDYLSEAEEKGWC